MEFWWGLTVGGVAGANIGIVLAGLLAGSKRKEINRDYLWDQLQMDQAVMDETPVETPRVHRFLTGASADPAQNL
jgi:hypothetical protein